MSDFQEKYGPWGVVVGGSKGLGGCFASECAQRGLNVVITGRTLETLEGKKKELEDKYGVQVRIVQADITHDDCAEKMLAACEDIEVGFIIFNAAVEPGGPFVKIPLVDHEAAIVGNCITPTRFIWPLVKKMAARGKGGVYLVSSMAGQGGIANWVSYGASKSYELILGEGLWYELKQLGIDAGTYVVGTTETPNFIEGQKKHGTGLTGQAKEEDLDQVSVPRTPAFVAEHLFDQIGDGPRLYSHPQDFETSTKMAMMSRADYVNAISYTTTKYFHGGTNDLIED